MTIWYLSNNGEKFIHQNNNFTGMLTRCRIYTLTPWGPKIPPITNQLKAKNDQKAALKYSDDTYCPILKGKSVLTIPFAQKNITGIDQAVRNGHVAQSLF